MSRKWCKMGGKLVLSTNRKSYMNFRLVPKSVTLNGVMALILRYFTEFGTASGALYTKVVKDVVKEVHVHYLICWWISCTSQSTQYSLLWRRGFGRRTGAVVYMLRYYNADIRPTSHLWPLRCAPAAVWILSARRCASAVSAMAWCLSVRRSQVRNVWTDRARFWHRLPSACLHRVLTEFEYPRK